MHLLLGSLLYVLQDMLHYNHHVEVPVKCVQGQLYVRISAHVYNVLEDYHRLAEAVDTTASTQSKPPSPAEH